MTPATPSRRIVAIIACAIACSLASCSGGSDSGSGGTGGSGAGGGVTGVYTSVDAAEVKLELKSGGTAVMSMGDQKGQPGTYTIDGEKIIVTMPDSVPVTFIRDGNCIEDLQRMFGKMCKGGAAAAAANVSTRTPPPTTGTWVATNEDGEFVIEFNPGNTLAMTMKPSAAVGGNPDTQSGKYTLEGDTMYITLVNSTPVVLKWVNGAYESTAFGLPMKFTKK